MAHDSKRGEKLAGWTHFAFAALYAAAIVWHFKATLEHFRRARQK